MKPENAIIWLRALANYFDRKAGDSQEDLEIQAFSINAAKAREIAELIQNNLK